MVLVVREGGHKSRLVGSWWYRRYDGGSHAYGGGDKGDGRGGRHANVVLIVFMVGLERDIAVMVQKGEGLNDSLGGDGDSCGKGRYGNDSLV